MQTRMGFVTHSDSVPDTRTGDVPQFPQNSHNRLPNPQPKTTMKRAISPVSSRSQEFEQQRKRIKSTTVPEYPVPDCPLSEEDAVASLLALFSKPSDATQAKPHNDDQRLVSDDEGDDDRSVASSSQESLTSTTCILEGDWRAFSRPLGPPPRLPIVPAGYVFPPAL
jgi:hypothetical protein